MPTPLVSGAVGLLGLPTDVASSATRGSAAGPAAIREALFSPASNLCSEQGVDLGRTDRFLDLGDLELDDAAGGRQKIEQAIHQLGRLGGLVISLGGDHSVSYPILRGLAPIRSDLTVVQIDAHPDLYDEFEGDRYSHACPFARVLEEGLVRRLVQVGIRTATDHQRDQAARFGVEMVGREQWRDLGSLRLEPPVYLSIDLDGFDPAFAPGVSHPEAGGLAAHDVLQLIAELPGLVGADVVELNPTRDVAGITAALGAKLVKELAGRMLRPD